MTRIETQETLNSSDRLKRMWEHVKRRLARDNTPDPDCATGPPYPHQDWPALSERQRKLDASVTPTQAAIDVRREREAMASRNKPHPQPDGFINDYD